MMSCSYFLTGSPIAENLAGVMDILLLNFTVSCPLTLTVGLLLLQKKILTGCYMLDIRSIAFFTSDIYVFDIEFCVMC